MIDADTIRADSRDLTALIDIDGLPCVDVDDKARGLVPTQDLVLRAGWRGTGLARLVPGLANVVGAAAHLLGHVEGQLILTRVIVVAIAHTLPHVHAVISSVDLHVLRGAHTGVVAKGVVAGPRATDPNVSRALVNIFTDACVLIEVVAEGALTLEAAKSVHTVATLAEARQLLALIDIFQDDSDGVGPETFSSRA